MTSSAPPTPQRSSTSQEAEPRGDGEQADIEQPAAKAKGKAKAKAKSRVAKDVSLQSPLERGEDLARQILKKKSEADELSLQMGTLPFGAGVKEELDKYTAKFESLSQFPFFFVHCLPQENWCESDWFHLLLKYHP